MNREQLNNFLWENMRRIQSPELLFGGFDDNNDSSNLFDSAEVRVLVLFLSDGETRALSNTYSALRYIIKKQVGDDVFVDLCCFHNEKALGFLQKHNVPLVFGNVSHAPYWDYDVIFVSHSSLPEVINVPYIFHNAGIPLGKEERMSNTSVPLIILGGAASTSSHILYGEVGGGDRSLIDLSYFGYGEGLVDRIAQFLVDFKRSKGDLKENKKALHDALKYDAPFKEYTYDPLSWKFHYESNGMTVAKIEKVDPKVPDKAKVNYMQTKDFGFPHKVFSMDGTKSSHIDLMISSGCTGRGCCSFCAEANLAGPYKEKSLSALKEDIKTAKMYSAPNVVSLFSFNLNYYSAYIDLMEELALNFEKFSLRNMRTDIVSVDEEYLQLAKRLKSSIVSMAVEGMGNRIRNNILNKNLSKQQLLDAMRNVFLNKFLQVKVGLIITGQETEEDMEDWLNELREIVDLKNSIGSTCHIRLNHSNLIIYHQTPLRWLPRNIAKQIWNRERVLGHYIEECKKMGISVKFSSLGVGTFVEQALCDFGRAGTSWLIDFTTEENFCYRSGFKKTVYNVLERTIKRNNIDLEFMWGERPLEEPLDSDTIQFTTEKHLDNWKEMHKEKDFRQPICLKTAANLNPECGSCGYCSSKEEVKEITDRELGSRKSYNDVIEALSEARSVDVSRILVKTKSKYAFYEKTSLSHYIASMFLRESEDLLDSFYKVGFNSMFWIARSDQKAFVSGKWVFDIHWKYSIDAKYLKDIANKVSDKLITSEVVDVYPMVKELPISLRDELVYFGHIENLPSSVLQEKIINFDWKIKRATRHNRRMIGNSLILGEVEMPELKDKIYWHPKGNDMMVVMTLPASVNPYQVLMSFTGDYYRDALHRMRITMLDHAKKLDISCSCGNYLHFSLIKNDYNKVCSNCMGKRMLYLYSQNKVLSN